MMPFSFSLGIYLLFRYKYHNLLLLVLNVLKYLILEGSLRKDYRMSNMCIPTLSHAKGRRKQYVQKEEKILFSMVVLVTVYEF